MHQEALFSLVSLELDSADSVKTKREQTVECAFTRAIFNGD